MSPSGPEWTITAASTPGMVSARTRPSVPGASGTGTKTSNGGDVGSHKLTFRWLSPLDEELWSSTGEMNVAPAPNPVFEVDLPIIAVVDLPLNRMGQYTMQVTLDDEPTAAVRLFVNGPAQNPLATGAPNGMVS